MKRFIVIIFSIIAIGILIDFGYYRWGFYLPKNEETSVVSYVEDGKMYIAKDDTFESITVRGVNMGGSIPGYYASDYAIDYKTYYRWLEDIFEMGANTIRLNTIFDDQFYNAFYDFNESHEEKLYLIQGINLDSYALDAHFDAFHTKFYGELVAQAENAVDVIHGRKKIALSRAGNGSYKKDISKYLLGYVVGSEWVDDTIIYTDQKNEDKKGFDGNYISTTDDVSAFETMLAKVIDHLITYETRKYRVQHNVSFINTPETDPVGAIPVLIKGKSEDDNTLYPETLKYHYHKMVKLDIDHLKSKNGYSGLFAAYNISSYYPNYLNYEKETYEDNYLSYLEKLTAHHEVPVLITEFAYSTARAIATKVADKYGNFGGMTEEEQGKALVEAYHAILKSGAVGGSIATWQDEWDKRTQNTLEKVDITRSIYWSDAQTTNQGLGLLTFDPGKKTSKCYVDGEINEWTTTDVISDSENIALSAKYDEKYLYLYIQKKKMIDGPIYIPIDTTTKSGASSSPERGISFNRDVDFLLILNGENGKLLVQEYYDVLSAVDGYELSNTNSYIDKPKADSTNFVPIRHLLEPYSNNKFSRNYMNPTLVETGILRFGNGNPNAKNYYSQADFYEVAGNIEVRIPWQILNFSDPSTMMIHDDYYENYGVDSYKIDELYIGAGYSSSIELLPLSLKGWGNKVTYHERLKKSYEIVKEDWRKLS